jgi:hypothetical protein
VKASRKVWIVLATLAVASPLGLYLPAKFKAGSAWGEWSGEEIGGMVGYIPQGLGRLSHLWHAPLRDYAFRGMDHAGLAPLSAAYVFSAITGTALCVVAGLAAGKLFTRRKSKVVKRT